jgi:predicted AAA+ superfamily ATPase
MTIVKRHGEQTVRELAEQFGAVLVTGARQVGKTTLMKELISKKRDGKIAAVSLDNAAVLKSAREEGETFFAYNPPPVFVDEIQYAPNLFPVIKQRIDEEQENGLFYLSGSQQFHLMKNASESLAGRIGILNLTGLSLREIFGVSFTQPFLPVKEYFSRRKKSAADIGPNQIWRLIHQGSMPALYAQNEPPKFNGKYKFNGEIKFDGQPVVSRQQWSRFYGAYVSTYIERDVRHLAQVGDELKFMNFMTVLAGSSAQMLNLSSVANDVGISNKTAERWLSILVTSNLVYLLRPFHTNSSQRAVKTPKLYFLDTGLAAYLTKWNTPEVIRDGARAGAFFENFIIIEILKSYLNAGELDPPLYFYRDKDKKEIDLLIWQNGALHPLEIKKTGAPETSDIKAFSVLDNFTGLKRGPGGVICLASQLLPLKGEDLIIPAAYI